MWHGLLPAHGLQRKKGLHGLGRVRYDTQERHCTVPPSEDQGPCAQRRAPGGGRAQSTVVLSKACSLAMVASQPVEHQQHS
jgi:hypothetical protein